MSAASSQPRDIEAAPFPASGERSTRPRIAHVVPAPEFAKVILLAELKVLGDRAEHVIVCPEHPMVDELRAAGLRVITVPMKRKIAPFSDLRSIAALVRVFRREKFDIVHSYVPKGGLVGQIAASIAGVPRRVHGCHGMLYTPAMSPGMRRLFRATDRLTNALAHRTLYVSDADREVAVREGLCATDSARHTGAGIDLHRFDPARVPAGTRERLRNELGIPLDATVILTCGRFVADKGYVELVQAAARLAPSHPRLRLLWLAPVLAGEDGVLPSDLAKQHGVGQIVIRLPYQDDVVPYYAASDTLAHPSYREGLPRVLLEAAAMGLPIIASDIPGCRQVIEDGITGTLVPAGDAEALTSALAALLADRASAASRAAALRASLPDRFSLQATAERVWDEYSALLKR